MSDAVRMVCFDAGGVLVRICRTWQEGCAAAGVEHRSSDEAAAGEQDRHAINARYQRGEIGPEEFFDAVAATTGGLYSSSEVLAVHDAWILGEYAGVRGLIDRLNGAAGLTTGLLSNTNPRHWAQPEMLGGESAVSSVGHAHASHLLGLIKPDGAIYRAFERETSFAGGEVLFFDDLAENIEAARAAGWRAEQIDHAGDTAAQIAAALVRHGVLI